MPSISKGLEATAASTADSLHLSAERVGEDRLRQRRLDRRSALVVVVAIALGYVAFDGLSVEGFSGYSRVRELSVQFTETLASFEAPEAWER